MSKQKKSREAFTEKCTHGIKTCVGGCCNDSIINDSTLSTVEPYKTIWNSISCGEENAIHVKELMHLTKIENRPLRKYIEQLRRSGYIIAATEKGYFRPKTQEELRQYILTEESRAESLLCTISAARELYSSLYGGAV